MRTGADKSRDHPEVLALWREELLRPKAKENQAVAGGNYPKAVSAKLPKAPSKIDTRKEAAEIFDAISESVEAERRAKISDARTNAEALKREENEPSLLQGETTQKIEPSPTIKNHATVDAKTAEAFGTNRAYVNQAADWSRGILTRSHVLRWPHYQN